MPVSAQVGLWDILDSDNVIFRNRSSFEIVGGILKTKETRQAWVIQRRVAFAVSKVSYHP